MAARASAAEIPSDWDDERLLIQAAQADPVRFATLYKRNFDRVYAFVARRSRSRGVLAELSESARPRRGRPTRAHLRLGCHTVGS